MDFKHFMIKKMQKNLIPALKIDILAKSSCNGSILLHVSELYHYCNWSSVPKVSFKVIWDVLKRFSIQLRANICDPLKSSIPRENFLFFGKWSLLKIWYGFMKNAINMDCSQESKDYFDVKFLVLIPAVSALEWFEFCPKLSDSPCNCNSFFTIGFPYQSQGLIIGKIGLP